MSSDGWGTAQLVRTAAVAAVVVAPLVACLLPTLDGLGGGAPDAAAADVAVDALVTADGGSSCPKSAIVTNGLVAWYPLDETSGAVAHDCSGNGYDAVVNGTASWAGGGIGGGALDLDGKGTCIVFPAVATLDFDGTGPFAVAFFATIATVSTTWPRYFLLGKTQNPAALGWRASVELSPTRFVLSMPNGDGGTATASSQPAAVAAGEVHHVFMQYQPSGGLRVFLDGVQRGTLPAPSVPFAKDSVTLRAGCSGDNQNFFAGRLDDVRIYNRGLTTTEIAELAAQK